MAFTPRHMMPGMPVSAMMGNPFTLATNMIPTMRLPMTVAQQLPPLPHTQLHINPPLPLQPPPMPIQHINRPPTYSQRIESAGPAITVFVGNITERAPDIMIRHILNACGPVLSWKRVQGASGKLQGFGFCEFANPETALRAIRILHDYEIASKVLVVRADSNTAEVLNEYKEKRKKAQNSVNSILAPGTSSPLQDEKPVEDDDDFLDEATKLEDRTTEQKINQILVEHRKDMVNYNPTSPKNDGSKRLSKVQEKLVALSSGSEVAGIPSTLNLDDMDDVEEGKKELISREITQFREQMKKQEEEKERERRLRERDNHRDRDRDKERDRERDRERERERERWEKEERRHLRRSPSRRSNSINRRSRSRSVEVRKSRKEKKKSRSKSGSPPRPDKDTYRLKEIEAEEKERKEQERKVRKKEIQYQERLKNWENREIKRQKELSRDKDREKDKVLQRERDANSLRQFLEDYDDERDDSKYYKGHLMDRKFMERDQEKDVDARDRAKEKEELQELRARIQNEGHQDPEEAYQQARLEREQMYQLKPILQHSKAPPPLPLSTNGHKSSEEIEEIPIEPTIQQDEIETDIESNHTPADEPMSTGEDNSMPSPELPEMEQIDDKPVEISSSNPAKRKKLNVRDVFNQDDDDDTPSKKRKLPLPGKEKSKEKAGGEEKRKHIKSLIDKIPTTKDELFAFPIDASLVDSILMEKRIRPWINKKIIEYIGEPEPTLVDFICSKVLIGSEPQSLLNDVQMVLDDEAEVFVVKMWRLLIYEIEAKRLGLGKA